MEIFPCPHEAEHGGIPRETRFPVAPSLCPPAVGAAVSGAAGCGPRTFQKEEISMTTIPLNQLVPAKANVRKTGGNDGIEELAAQMAILHSFVVHWADIARWV
jgi:hypothetical protein